MSRLTSDLVARYASQIDRIFTLVGSTWFINYFGVYVLTPLSVAGFFLNIISFVINHRLAGGFNTIGTYRYLRIYCLIGAINCFILSFGLAAFGKRIFYWTISVENFRFILHFYSPVVNICYFYTTLLDILITIDRISVLKPAFRLIRLERINLVCFVVFVAVVVINTPYYLNFEPSSINVPLYKMNKNGSLYSDEYVTWWITASTTFSLSPIGSVLNIILNSFRDGFLLVAEILVNALSVYYLRQHVNQRRRRPSVQNSGGNKSIVSNEDERVTKSQLKLTQMVIVISILSVLEHVMMIVAVLLPYLPNYDIPKLALFSMTASASVTIKNFLTFFVLLSFNRKFRLMLHRACKKLFRLARLTFLQMT